ncbi:hypothetical protein DPX16_4729 [Anabarilius grahami]|uniref:Immunoglobulin domain-containing protein n=1 Tax=Anabarilius grahami TaxID=495550 RepID=A0A3N0YHX6_ANAGA|nr:hypothetical protein DPX16_4729 [Anabarilius grahami]
MEGDSVTLRIDLAEIQGFTKIIWNYGNEIIAKILEGNLSLPNSDERFRDRLKLDEQTGSLTITNIRTEHAGDYSVDVKKLTTAKLTKFKVTIHGGVKTVSVKEGESVILHTDVTEIQGYDLILWKKEDYLVAEFNQQTKLFLRRDRDNRFNGRLQLHPQTGSVIISDSGDSDSGVYHLNMNSSSHNLQRTISVAVKSVFSNEKDGVKTVSEKKGNSVLLHTRVTEIEKDDPIEWTFGPQNISIAKTDGKSKIISYNDTDVRFNNRLHLQTENGDLTIKHANSEHSGLYQIKIINNTFTIQKRFSVTVSGE